MTRQILFRKHSCSPQFRRHALGLASQILDQVEDYRRSGYRVMCFVMIDGSPVCGLRKTPQPAQAASIQRSEHMKSLAKQYEEAIPQEVPEESDA
jgi:predicted secreted protein